MSDNIAHFRSFVNSLKKLFLVFLTTTKRAFAFFRAMLAGRTTHEALGVNSCFYIFRFHGVNVTQLAAIVKDFFLLDFGTGGAAPPLGLSSKKFQQMKKKSPAPQYTKGRGTWLGSLCSSHYNGVRLCGSPERVQS